MDIRIEKPTLSRKSTEANMALVDTWIADTSDKLNMFIEATNIELDKLKEIINERDN